MASGMDASLAHAVEKTQPGLQGNLAGVEHDQALRRILLDHDGDDLAHRSRMIVVAFDVQVEEAEARRIDAAADETLHQIRIHVGNYRLGAQAERTQARSTT